jgi:hypothetical protein
VAGSSFSTQSQQSIQPQPPPSNAVGLRHQSRGGGVRPIFYQPQPSSSSSGAQQPTTIASSNYAPAPPLQPATNSHAHYHHHTAAYEKTQPPPQPQQPTGATAASHLTQSAISSHPNSGPYNQTASAAAERGVGRSGAVAIGGSPSKGTSPAMTPAIALTKFGAQLAPYEQNEILEYSHVYFVGGGAAANKIHGVPHTANNNGYDDEKGDYRLTIHDHLEYRYEVLSVLGRGSFGQVVKVMDHKNNMILALKMIRNKKRFHHQALVEVKILEHLMNKDKEHKSNIVRMYGYFYFRNHLCITFEPLSINLYEFIKNNGFKGVSLALIRRFAIQLLVSLKFLRRERIVHCDLKPENVLLKAPNKATIKLIDFGSSCFEVNKTYGRCSCVSLYTNAHALCSSRMVRMNACTLTFSLDFTDHRK